ncbi:MAG: four helix bundle protein [Dehalococcoidia bacterium]|nr:four helix bundle protein [Dehalococcoidia bacterium]
MDADRNRRQSEPLIPRHGGYRNLKSFQVAQLVYDVTAAFCEAHIERRSRTHDQMVQAARSGVQNIAEGSQASATSRKTEMKLTNVARASLEELRLDYEDYLRQRNLGLWGWKDPRRAELIARRPTCLEDVMVWVHWAEENGGQNGQDGHHGQQGQEKEKERQSTQSIQSMPSIPRRPGPHAEALANGALALIAVATSLLSRQLAAQAAAFEREGGFTERLYSHRRTHKEP